MSFVTKKNIENWIKAGISFFIIVVPSLYFGLIEKNVQMGLALIVGAIAAAFINIDKFSRFKGGGFEAEMKKAVEDINDIKEIIKPLIFSTNNLLIADSRFGGMDADTKYDLLKKLDQLIDSLEINDIDIEKSRRALYRDLVNCYYSEFVGSISTNPFIIRQVLHNLTLPSLEEITNEFRRNNMSIDDIDKRSNSLLNKYLSYKNKLL